MADVAAAAVVVVLEEVKGLLLLLYARAVKSGGTVVALAVESLWHGHTAESRRKLSSRPSRACRTRTDSRTQWPKTMEGRECFYHVGSRHGQLHLTIFT